MRQLRTEAVHHAHRAVAIRLYQRMRKIEAQQKLLHADAAVDQVNLEVAFPQHAIPILELLRRDDLNVVAFLTEVVAKKLVFALADGLKRRAEFDYCDIRLLMAAPLLVCFEERREQMLLAADLRELISLAKFLDGRDLVEQVRKAVGVGGPA